MRAGIFVCLAHRCVPTSRRSWPVRGAQGEAVDWRRADSHGGPRGRGAAFVKHTLCAGTGRRLPSDATWNTLRLRGGLGAGDQMFAGDHDGGWWAGVDFGSQTRVWLRITRQSFPEMESLRPQAMLTKILIPWETDSWEIKSRLHQILTKWPWTNTDQMTLDESLNLPECSLWRGDHNYLMELSRGLHELRRANLSAWCLAHVCNK